jgi:3-dehydroquinate dehydratase/shikimate dehydrogenase
MLCGVIKGPTYEEATQQLAEAQAHCFLVELRLDFFKTINNDQIETLRRNFSIPMIFTLRSTLQGGVYTGSEEEKIQQMMKLAFLKPEYIDLEYTISQTFIAELRKKYPTTKIIVSYHDFKKMPSPDHVRKEMQRLDADIYKMAFMLKSSVEALSLLLFMRVHASNVLAMGMGPFGESTRILGPIFGACFVYGSIEQESTTAPGQIPVKTLSEIYRYNHLSPATSIYGLIGDPVNKSLSHISHNSAFQLQNIDAVFVKFPLAQNEVENFLILAKELGVRGLSITMPLKEVVIPFLEDIDPWAKKIGAVNTLLFEDGKIKGFNTDGKGALDAIEEKIKVSGKKIVFIGAGGAAKAVIAEAIDRGAIVIILNRDEKRALDLANKMDCSGGPLEQMQSEFDSGYDILINATPSLMPIDTKWIISGTVVMDLKTQPQNTEFLKEAKAKKCTLVYGYEMFVNQAVEQFKIWLGDKIDLKKAKQTLRDTVLKNIQKD